VPLVWLERHPATLVPHEHRGRMGRRLVRLPGPHRVGASGGLGGAEGTRGLRAGATPSVEKLIFISSDDVR